MSEKSLMLILTGDYSSNGGVRWRDARDTSS